MYDIELFKNIFAEGEILCMSDDFIECLGRLLDDKVSARLLQFFERFEDSEIRSHTDNPIAVSLTKKVDRLKEFLGDRVKRNTFHLEVIEKDVLKFVSQLNIETALLTIDDRKAAIETLEWLLDNREYWISYIAVRQKSDYEEFLQRCQDMVFATRSLEYSLQEAGMGVSVKRYDNLIQRVKANKEFFYSPNERKRATHMAKIIMTVSSIQMVLHGLKYQEECSRLEIPRSARRSFRQ